MMGDGFAGCCGFGGWGSFGAYGWIINLVITVAIIVGVILLVMWLVRQVTSGSPNTNSSGNQQATALDIAQSRYARGEISREEYQQISNDLSA